MNVSAALRLCGKQFVAPPQIKASSHVHRQTHPQASVGGVVWLTGEVLSE